MLIFLVFPLQPTLAGLHAQSPPLAVLFCEERQALVLKAQEVCRLLPTTDQTLLTSAFRGIYFALVMRFKEKAARLPVAPKKKRVDALRAWFNEHLTDPYPTKEIKARLALESGMTFDQVSTWFVNERSRRPKARSPATKPTPTNKKTGEDDKVGQKWVINLQDASSPSPNYANALLPSQSTSSSLQNEANQLPFGRHDLQTFEFDELSTLRQDLSPQSNKFPASPCFQLDSPISGSLSEVSPCIQLVSPQRTHHFFSPLRAPSTNFQAETSQKRFLPLPTPAAPHFSASPLRPRANLHQSSFSPSMFWKSSTDIQRISFQSPIATKLVSPLRSQLFTDEQVGPNIDSVRQLSTSLLCLSLENPECWA